MKKCEHFRDLILTDHIDGQLDKNAAGSLENHLLKCSDCREFFKEIKDKATLPWAQALRQPVPAELWIKIQEKIENEERSSDLISDLLDRIKGLIVYPRLVPVLASLVLMLLVGSVTVNTIQIKQAQEKDQGEYLISLLSSSSQAESNDLGTPIEHYFL